MRVECLPLFIFREPHSDHSIILLKKYRNIRTFSKETESEMAEGLNNKHVRNGQQEEVGLSKDRYLHLKRKEGIDLFWMSLQGRNNIFLFCLPLLLMQLLCTSLSWSMYEFLAFNYQCQVLEGSAGFVNPNSICVQHQWGKLTLNFTWSGHRPRVSPHMMISNHLWGQVSFS